MIPPLKPGARLLRVDGPVVETARLILRPWCSTDIAANTAMLSDPGTARYITPDGVAITTEIYTLSLHDALPIWFRSRLGHRPRIPWQGLCGGSGAGVDRLDVRDF